MGPWGRESGKCVHFRSHLRPLLFSELAPPRVVSFVLGTEDQTGSEHRCAITLETAGPG